MKKPRRFAPSGLDRDKALPVDAFPDSTAAPAGASSIDSSGDSSISLGTVACFASVPNLGQGVPDPVHGVPNV